MFKNTNLQTLLETASVIKNESTILAEWNLNNANNILELGNYRFRPTIGSPTEANFGVARSSFVKEDATTASPYYYGATDSQVAINAGYTNADYAQAFASNKDKNKMLFSLQDCLGRFRPRSGINKAVHYSANTFLNYSNKIIF